jgi:hypothetical protein
MQNGRVLRDAPLVFIAALAIAFGIAYWALGLKYEGALDQKTATIETLKTQITELERRTDDLRQQLVNRPQPSPVVHDPDGVYQFGTQVGLVQDVQIDESRGIVSFGAIVGAVKLNTHNNFEYRDFILHVKSAGADEQASLAGERSRSLIQVTCEIVERVSHQ